MTFCALLYMQAAYRIRSYMFLYFHFSLCDVWVWDSKGTMLADRLTKIEDATFGNHVRQSSFDGLCLKKCEPRFLSLKEMLTVPDAEQAVDDLDALEAPTCATCNLTCSQCRLQDQSTLRNSAVMQCFLFFLY